MKELFLKSLELIKEVPAFRHADLDKGQIDTYENRPAIAFPAVLIRIEYPKTENIGGMKQKCLARITLRAVFDYTGQTSGNTPDAVLQESLEYFDTVNALHDKFQGFFGNGFTRFDRTSLTEEKRRDGLKVVNLPYSTSLID